MKKLILILGLVFISLSMFSEIIRKEAKVVNSNDTLLLTYSGGIWTLKSDTFLIGIFDTIYINGIAYGDLTELITDSSLYADTAGYVLNVNPLDTLTIIDSLNFKGTWYTTLANVDTTGVPAINQIAIFSEPSKITGNSYLTTDNIIIDASTRNNGYGNSVFNALTTGTYNTGIGYQSFYSNTEGSSNTGVGVWSLYSNTEGDGNSGIGLSSLYNNTTGMFNSGIGYRSLFNNSTGSNNIGVGYYAGKNFTTESNRMFISSIERLSKSEDSTLSIIYGLQAATTADQQLYLNANVNISDDLTVSGLTTGRLLYNTSGTLTTSQELTFDGSNFYAGGVAGITNFAVYPDYFAASSNVSSQISTNDGGLGGNITITSAGIEIQADDAPIVTDIDHLKYSIKNGADTLVKIYPDSAVFFKNIIIKGNFILDGTIEHHSYEKAMFTHPDSTVTTSATTTWQFIGDGQNNKFTHIISNDFSFNGDTLQFDQDASDLRDSIKFRIHYCCTNAASSVNETIYTGIFVKHTGGEYIEIPQLTSISTTSTAGVYYPGPVCTAMPIWLQDGDNIQIRIKIESGTSTLSTKNFKIYMYEK